jgi:hypothetical protein
MFFILILLFSFPALSQTDTSRVEEELFEFFNEEEGTEQDNMIIEEYLQNRININEADLFELEKIPYINFTAAQSILEYRKKYGYFFSVNELFSINAIDEEIISKILPFVSVGTEPLKSNQINTKTSVNNPYKFKVLNRISKNFPDNKAYKDNLFEGDPFKIVTKIKTEYNLIKAGATIEKDPGERSYNDFSSFYLSINNYSIFNKIIYGDYITEFGEGLVVWGPYSSIKGPDAIHPFKKNGRYLTEYTGVDENRYLRGGAFTAGYSDFSLTAFYSNKKFDASVSDDGNLITSIPYTGYHRTKGELNRNKNESQIVIGSRIDFNDHENFSGGILYFNSNFSKPLDLKKQKGNNFNYYSLYYKLLFNNHALSGETGSDGNNIVTLNNINFNINRNFSAVISIRNYSNNFNNLYGSPFSEKNYNNYGEWGIYYGIKWKTEYGLTNLYYDQFKNSASDLNFPTTGDELLFNYQHKLLKELTIKIRYRRKSEDIKGNENNLKTYIRKNRENYRFETEYQVDKNLKIKGRLEYVMVKTGTGNNEEGFLFFNEVQYSPFRFINISSRISFYETDSFNSTIYAYESDSPTLLNALPLFGRGMRWYGMVKVKVNGNSTVSFKYGESFEPGLDVVEGKFVLQGEINL